MKFTLDFSEKKVPSALVRLQDLEKHFKHESPYPQVLLSKRNLFHFRLPKSNSIVKICKDLSLKS